MAKIPNIKNLPKLEEIISGNYLITLTDNGIATINYDNVIFEPVNTTYYYVIESNEAASASLSSDIDTLSASMLQSAKRTDVASFSSTILTDVKTVSSSLTNTISSTVNTLTSDMYSVSSTTQYLPVFWATLSANVPANCNALTDTVNSSYYGNINSVCKLATGCYIVNLNPIMPSTNFIVLASLQANVSGSAQTFTNIKNKNVGNFCVVTRCDTGGTDTPFDPAYISFVGYCIN